MTGFDKRSKMVGVSVTSEEVIASLGHPRTWLASFIFCEFRDRLRHNQDDLDIQGIIGVPGLSDGKGYLDLLREWFEKPIGSSTNLVLHGENEAIIKEARVLLAEKIRHYEARLVFLWSSLEAVQYYIIYLKNWLPQLEKQLEDERKSEDKYTEEICAEWDGISWEEWKRKQIARLENDIQKCKIRIQEYENRLEKLG